MARMPFFGKQNLLDNEKNRTYRNSSKGHREV